MSSIRIAAGVIALSLAAGCAGAPFSYSQDRCLGAHNQCQTDCLRVDNGPARSACIERCYDRESQCYATGDDGTGSSMAQDALIGRSRSEAEKEADYQRWKAQRDRERAESGEAPPDVEIQVIEPEDKKEE